VYGEAFPIVGAEAAGLGIPVITTNLGSCAEFVDDPRFLVPPGNAAALADALRTYIGLGDEERAGLSREARARAEQNYDPQAAYERYRALFARLIGQRNQVAA
jgi:glycosyltransferase involved in cell wall biosynthesis